MKKQALFIASIFLLAACAGDFSWQRANDGGEAALETDNQVCQTIANKELKTSNPRPGTRYGIARGKSLENRTVAYEGCMLDKGWDKTESS